MMAKTKSTEPPSELLDAFRAVEKVDGLERLGAIVADDGFDAEAVRVIVAWMNVEHRWCRPDRACPDGGRPTQRAWIWLVSGIDLDVTAVADAANVSRGTARAKIAVLLGAKLVYPGGDVTKGARAALQSMIASRARAKKKAKPQQDYDN